MAEFRFTGFLGRWLISMLLVAATYNPSGWSYVDWVGSGDADQLPLKVLAGLVLADLAVRAGDLTAHYSDEGVVPLAAFQELADADPEDPEPKIFIAAIEYARGRIELASGLLLVAIVLAVNASRLDGVIALLASVAVAAYLWRVWVSRGRPQGVAGAGAA